MLKRQDINAISDEELVARIIKGVNINAMSDKELVARFCATVDPYTLPIVGMRLSDLDEFEVDEMLSQGVVYNHGKDTVLTIPSIDKQGMYTFKTYKYNEYEYTLESYNYTPTFTEMAEILRIVEWKGAPWLDDKDVKEAMEHLQITENK